VTPPLRVLILEDRPADAELMAAALEAEGLGIDWERVDDEPGFLAALGRGPDVILSELRLPQFDARRALALRRERAPGVPFIVVLGTIGEEAAVACMREGATDYLLKDRLGRLGSSVRRAVEEGRHRTEAARMRAEAERERAQAVRLAAVGRLLSESLDTERVSRVAIDALQELLGARSAAIYRLAPDGTAATLAMSSGGGDEGYSWAPRLEPGEGLVGMAMATGRGATTENVLADPRMRFSPATRQEIARGVGRAVVAVPIRGAAGVIGALAVADRAGRVFDAPAVALAETFAAQVAVAIQNAELYGAVERELAERRRAEAALRAATDAIAAIVECSPLAIVSYDVEARVTSWNPAAEALFGWRRDEALGRRRPGVAPEHRAALETLAERVRAGERLTGVEVLLQRRGQVDVRTLCSVAPLRDAAGSVVGAVAFLEDIGARKQAELAARESEKLAVMGSLLAGVAHELNNPLAVVLGQAQLLRSRVAGDQALEERVDRLVRAADRCARLVRTFLALARRRPPERQAVSLNGLVKESLDLLGYSLRLEQVEVETDLGEDLPPFLADADQLAQVLMNLVTNAVHAMQDSPPPRRVTLRTRYQPATGTVTLQVADTGPGIRPEVLPRIFEPFVTTKPPGQGTGLGLSLCQGFVQAHGGRIGAANAPGGGALFTLELPAGGVGPVAAPSGPPPASDPSRRARVLVVDDEREIAEVLADVLRLDGHETLVLGSAAEALRVLEAERFDVVFSDVRMPEMDGLAFHREVRRRWPGLAGSFVFVTGDTLSPQTQAALAGAAAATLEKPFAREDVRRVMRGMLAAPGGAG
jgi:two-component system NtrC family sensor kinase